MMVECLSMITLFIYIFYLTFPPGTEGRHQQEMTTYSGLCPIGPTLSSVTLQTSSAVVSRMLPRDNVHQPRLPHLTAAGTGSGKLILPRKPSVAYGLSSPHRTRGQLSGVPLVNGEVGMSAGRSVAAADRQVSNVPSCPHPSLFFKVIGLVLLGVLCPCYALLTATMVAVVVLLFIF